MCNFVLESVCINEERSAVNTNKENEIKCEPEDYYEYDNNELSVSGSNEIYTATITENISLINASQDFIIKEQINIKSEHDINDYKGNEQTTRCGVDTGQWKIILCTFYTYLSCCTPHLL